MLKKLFGKKSKDLDIYAPITGKLKSLSEVPDQVFSEKMMGDGVAFEATEGKVVSPIDGEIAQLFPTKHAVGLRSDNGVEILIHVGIDTVDLKGEGFTAHVKQGDKVKVGDLLLDVDFKLIKEKGKHTITPMIITNGDDIESLEKKTLDAVTKSSDLVMKVVVK